VISLLIDAATAAVVVLDRFCTAVGNVRLQTTASPPLSSEGGAPSPGLSQRKPAPGDTQTNWRRS
jgi:hypothetical protein